jgi:hypothetical protein
MYKSIILPLAKEDIREAAIWYNKQQNGLGKRFTAEVRENVHFIRQNPEASNIRYENVRTTVLNVFLYGSLYHRRTGQNNNRFGCSAYK